uniref:Putative phosphoheptose isomerase n=1 Tax=Magnetococcus massalia (strain MO-1) TaxID=451514 RepID=A0A1S7LL37_MAGMO|nr:putative phosphoheptose isomerase [Candidatus Magnetococcus massalia]
MQKATPLSAPFSAQKWLESLAEQLGQTRCRCRGSVVELSDGFTRLAELLRQQAQAARSVWWIGNGGSAAICSHLSQDLINKLNLRSHTLNDASLMSCMANDYGYESVYLQPLQKLARPDDLLIAISSSGNSANIVQSAQWALEAGLNVVTLSAFAEDNKLWQLPSHLAFYLPTTLYGQAEVGHEALLHSVIETLWLADQN